MIICQERVIVDGRLVAYCGQPLTVDEAKALGLNEEGKFATAKKVQPKAEKPVAKRAKK